MAKKAKRKSNGHAARTAVDQARDRERQYLQRAVRHQKKLRALNRQLTSAIQAADRSIIELHSFLSAHPAIADVDQVTDAAAGATARPT